MADNNNNVIPPAQHIPYPQNPEYSGPPQYQQPPYQPPSYQPQQQYYPPPPAYSQATPNHVESQPLLHQNHSHVTVVTHPEEDNCMLGCCMGFFFGLFGLCCLMCVNNKSSYLKGWLVPFIVSTIAAIIVIILFAVGTISAANQ